MKNLPRRIYLNLRNTWQVIKGNKCLPDDFIKLRDDCGECLTHTLGEPNHEDDPEYILNDKGEFVPEEWGWGIWCMFEDAVCYWFYEGSHQREYALNRAKFDPESLLWNFLHYPKKEDWPLKGKEIYSGPLTPTLYRLIAEANEIPIPAGK